VAQYAVCVDISAKIERWDKASVIAVANGHTRALLIEPEVKVAAIRLIRKGEPAQFALMAVFTFLAVRPDLDSMNRITLDQDYSGKVAERQILRRLVQMIRRERPLFKASALRIAEVRGSNADILAREVFRGLKRPNGVITLADIEAVL
jgi:hypothetical protein